MKPEHLKLLRDRFWRLNNLYFITDKQGKKVRFRMTQEQVDYFQGMHTRNIILKARQLGFTTLVCIVQLDAALFEAAKCALIAHTLNDAKRLFREKVKYATTACPRRSRRQTRHATTLRASWCSARADRSMCPHPFGAGLYGICTYLSSGRSVPSFLTKPERS